MVSVYKGERESGLPSTSEEQPITSIDPRVKERVDEVMAFMQEIECDPSRQAFPDGILPNELGC